MESTIGTAPDTAPAQEHRFEFNGSGGEYFRIWIVNLLLTLVTLGIYGAWAKVRRLRYFYGNTVLAGSAFEYHGVPTKILKGRAIATAVLLPIYLIGSINPAFTAATSFLILLAIPLIVVRSRRFQMSMSSWRNLRLSFVGSYGEAIGIYIGKALLASVTLGLLYPSLAHAKQKYLIGNSKLGSTLALFSAQRSAYYVTYAQASLLLILGILVSIGISIAISGSRSDFLMTLNQPELSSPTEINNAYRAVFLLVLLALLTILIVNAFIKARLTNLAFGNTFIGLHQLRSRLSPSALAWLYLKNILLVTVTFGLYLPFAKIRLIRFQLEGMSLVAHGNLDEFVKAESSTTSATGEGLGDFLDIDFGL